MYVFKKTRTRSPACTSIVAQQRTVHTTQTSGRYIRACVYNFILCRSRAFLRANCACCCVHSFGEMLSRCYSRRCIRAGEMKCRDETSGEYDDGRELNRCFYARKTIAERLGRVSARVNNTHTHDIIQNTRTCEFQHPTSQQCISELRRAIGSWRRFGPARVTCSVSRSRFPLKPRVNVTLHRRRPCLRQRNDTSVTITSSPRCVLLHFSWLERTSCSIKYYGGKKNKKCNFYGPPPENSKRCAEKFDYYSSRVVLV